MRARAAFLFTGLVAGLGLLALLRRGAADPAAGAGQVSEPASGAAGTSDPAPLSSASPELDRALGEFLGAVPLEPTPTTEALLAEALEQARRGDDPATAARDYRQALTRLLGARPDAPRVAAGRLVEGEELPESLQFQHALALSEGLDAPATDALLVGLPRAGPRARPWVAFALRGRRGEPRVQEALLARYAGDDSPAVRARAGFVLGEGGAELAPALLERARQVARGDLRSEDPELVAAAADVLGVPPLGEGDRALLLEVAERDPAPRRREAALRALVAAGTPRQELVPLLERLARDPQAGEPLRQAAREALAAPGE